MRAFALLLLAFAPAAALAGGGHEAPHADGPSLLRHTINLLVLVAVLWKVGATPLRDFLAFRKSEIEGGLEAAWAAKERAEARAAELDGRIAGIDTELSTLLDQVRTDGAAERARIEAAARRGAEAVDVAARRTVQDEIERARAELRLQAVDAALAAAEGIVSRTIGAPDQHRLASRFVEQIGTEVRA